MPRHGRSFLYRSRERFIFSTASTLTAGVASFVSSGAAGIIVRTTAASNGTPPITVQWQRSLTSGSGFADLTNSGTVSGATTVQVIDGSAISGVLYYYRAVFTDSVAAQAVTNEVSAQAYYSGGALSPASGGDEGGGLALVNIPLNEVVYLPDLITANPSTGAVSDADSTPTFEVFEEGTDTDIGVGGSYTKRTSKTGTYRATFTLSTANGFEVGKFYSVDATYTVAAIPKKKTVAWFRVALAEGVAGAPKVDIDYALGATLTASDFTVSAFSVGFLTLPTTYTNGSGIVDAGQHADAILQVVEGPGDGLVITLGAATGTAYQYAIVAGVPATVTLTTATKCRFLSSGNVNAKRWSGAAINPLSLPVATAAGGIGGVFIAGSNAATTINGLTTGALACTTVTASGAVSLQATLAVTGTTTLTGAVVMSGGLTANITGNISGSVGSVTGAVGSVTGAVGSVTGAVGSVTGNVGGNVVGTVASVTGSVGSVSGNVGGNVVGSVASVTGNVGGNVVGSVASVTATVVTDMTQTTRAEPAQGAPAATATPAAKLDYLYKATLNKKEQTATAFKLYNAAGAVVDQKATVADDGTTTTVGAVTSGP